MITRIRAALGFWLLKDFKLYVKQFMSIFPCYDILGNKAGYMFYLKKDNQIIGFKQDYNFDTDSKENR